MGNSKKRKLQYIRKKNGLRNGVSIFHYLRVPIDADDEFINHAVSSVLSTFEKKYKMPLECGYGNIKTNDVDTINKLGTISLIIKKT